MGCGRAGGDISFGRLGRGSGVALVSELAKLDGAPDGWHVNSSAARMAGAMKRYLALFALFTICAGGSDLIDVQNVVDRATSTMQADWAAAPGFAFVQRDVTTSKGMTTCKTHQVFMISGADYYMPVAVEDNPLSVDQQKLELQRLKKEVDRRSEETPAEVQQRAEQYRKTREQNGTLLSEFTRAFDFTLAGEETINGHATYVLNARPRAAYHAPNRTAKILTGMQGRLWIDKESFHWVKAEAEVMKSVSVFGLFAKALPGTKMELEMTPVTDSVWLVSRFVADLRLSILWWKSAKATESTFSGYRPAAAALAEALAMDNTAQTFRGREPAISLKTVGCLSSWKALLPLFGCCSPAN